MLQLDATDVLILYAADAGTISPEQRVNLAKFTGRGGGIVVIHDAIVGNDPDWFKTVVGGAWQNGKTKWHEGDVGIYFQDSTHPVSKGIADRDAFDFVKDEEVSGAFKSEAQRQGGHRHERGQHAGVKDAREELQDHDSSP